MEGRIKRQVRPNLSRADFGYVARSRATTKAFKSKDDPEAAGLTLRTDKDARSSLAVDFTKLDMATLKRYKRHYRLKTRQNVTKTELSAAISKHFAAQTVDEADTISLFMYSARANNLEYNRRDYLNVR